MDTEGGKPWQALEGMLITILNKLEIYLLDISSKIYIPCLLNILSLSTGSLRHLLKTLKICLNQIRKVCRKAIDRHMERSDVRANQHPDFPAETDSVLFYSSPFPTVLSSSQSNVDSKQTDRPGLITFVEMC